MRTRVKFVQSGPLAWVRIFLNGPKMAVLAGCVLFFTILLLLTNASEGEILTCITSGFFGAFAMLRLSDLSMADVSGKEMELIAQRLRLSKFISHEGGMVWKSPLPGWLVWDEGAVRFERQGPHFRVYGSFLYLRRLIQRL